MGWRFRKTFKLFPGVRLNVGKKGINSVTVGKRGLFSTNVNNDGVRHTASVSGTGISYQTNRSGFPSDNAPQNGSSNRNALIIVGVVIGVLIAICGMCSILGRLSPPTTSNSVMPLKSASSPNVIPSPSPQPKKTAKRNANASQKYEKPAVEPTASKFKEQSSGKYITGPRGGCYYINSRGNKTYVDHSYCN